MTRIGVLMLCISRLGCDPGSPEPTTPPPDFRAVRDECNVPGAYGSRYCVTEFHDDKRGVTCWKLGSGLSRLPDSALGGSR